MNKSSKAQANLNLPVLEGGSPVRKKLLIFGKPQIKQDEIDEVVDSLKSGWLGTGPKVSKFEDMVKSYLGVKHAVALNSCTAGLHLSLLAFGIKRGDEVIVPTMTFAASANVVEHIGAKPVFVDCELPSQNIDPKEIEKKITKKTKAIIVVDMAGRPCDMDKIMAIAKKHKIKVLEDAAHAFGAEYMGKKIGTIADITVFSFYVTKNLITGEGGMITTNNKKYADFIKVHALHGMSHDAWRRYLDRGFKRYLVVFAGYKYNMMDLQAAIGIHQLKRFDENQIRRKEIWNRYNKAFKDLPIQTPADPAPNTVHAYHLYTILLDPERLKIGRDRIQLALHKENIGIGTHFIALHLHPFYLNKYTYPKNSFPNSEYISERTISIPFSALLSDDDVKDVINAVTKLTNYYSINCKKLDWDTKHFGINTGRVNTNKLNQNKMTDVLNWSKENKIKCLYFLADFNDSETAKLAEDNNFRFIDLRVTYKTNTTEIPSHLKTNTKEIRAADKNDLTELKRIASSSFYDSRFYFDTNFDKKKSGELYEIWVQKAFDNENSEVLVVDIKGKVAGFISISIDKKIGDIGLIAIDENHRGKGFGGKLLNAALNWFNKKGAQEVEVVTQGRNLGSQKLYQKYGFRLADSKIWYHKWFS